MEDVPSRVYNVTASFVVVKGQLVAGSLTKQFSAYLSFLLVPNPNNRLGLTVSAPAFPNRTNTERVNSSANIGHKAFAVVRCVYTWAQSGWYGQGEPVTVSRHGMR